MAKSILDKYKSIDQTKISKEAKTILLKIKVKTRNFKETTPETNKVFNTFYSKLQESKPQAIKVYKAPTKATPKAATKPAPKASSKISAAQLLKEAKKRRANQGISTSKSDIEKDAVRPAKPKGYRITDGTNYPYVKGNKYWEGRENRLDRKQPPKKYPKLEHGGMMAKGGFTQYGEPMGFEEESDSVYEIHHKPEMNAKNPYLIWDKIDGVYVAEFPNNQRALHYIDSKKSGYFAKGGMVVTSIKDIPNFKERLEQGRITYRGLGMGKLSDDFYDLTGTHGARIKVDGKEYFITDEEFDTFNRNADGTMRIRFDAPYRKFKDGGMMAKGGETEEGVNLFEDYDDIPDNVQKILDKYEGAFEDGEYKGLNKALKELNKIGYTFEYGLDGGAYDLRKIGQLGKSEVEYKDGGYMAKGGNVTPKEKMIKELHKLQRDLNSSRLSQYREGDTSEEEMARKRERDSKLARFNEILEVLNQEDKKMADGGYMAKGGMLEHGLKEGDLIVFESLSEDNSIEVTNRYDGKRYIVNLNEGKREEVKSKSKIADGGYMAKGGEVGERHRMEIGG